jgi:hypothetical protein
MELQHVNVKLFARGAGGLKLGALIPVFQSWIEKQSGDELLLDIADYSHVHDGPGVILIGHQGDYSVDNTDGRLGVRYNRKTLLDGSNQERLTQATRAALSAFVRLEAEPRLEGKLLFGGREIEVFINDRLLAPNTEATRQTADGELQTFFRKLFREREFSLSYASDARRAFGATAKLSTPFAAAELLANLGD